MHERCLCPATQTVSSVKRATLTQAQRPRPRIWGCKAGGPRSAAVSSNSDASGVSCSREDDGLRVGRRLLLASPPITAALGSLLTPPAYARAVIDESQAQKVYTERRSSVVGIADIQARPNAAGTEKASPTGSGFVWDQRGHIVTSAHVVSKLAANASQETRVYFTDFDGVQRQSRARVVGISQEFDLAVLYVDLPPEYLDPAELGQPAALRVGQSCYVIGKQAGQGHTLTFGVISGLNRRVVAMNGAMIRRAIQTDADISMDTSGGALVDSRGRLMGINVYPQGRNIARAPGVNFAMPMDTVMQVVPQLIAYGEVKTPVDDGPSDAGPRPAVWKR